MTPKQAAKIAIECIKVVIRRDAFDANCYQRTLDGGGTLYPAQLTHLLHYQSLVKALYYFERIIRQGGMEI